ncbi:MAG: VirB8/TrbF family protein [Rickettsiaceae bacterium]|nr:VirB8/TrbF family protein [Rickettsiaceae bacterium]
MEPLYKSLKEYIETGEYFVDARYWYKHKYINPFSQRSFVFILSAIICVSFLGLVININSLFPSVIQIKYSISATTSANKAAQIIRADQIKNDPQSSVTDILVKNYVSSREEYNYSDLKKQFIFVKNNSTRIVFRRFYNLMNLDNPSSPVLKYQKDKRRSIKVISTSYPSKTKAIVNFNSIVQNSAGEISENIVWQATIDYEIDKINPNLSSGSRFNFTVTDYQLKLIEDRSQK